MQSLYNELKEKYSVTDQNIQTVSEFNNLDQNPFSAMCKYLLHFRLLISFSHFLCIRNLYPFNKILMNLNDPLKQME